MSKQTRTVVENIRTVPNKADAASPTFSGTVTLPATTSIGTVSSTEIGYVDGVTSAIQTQIASKQSTLVSGTSIKTVNGASVLGSGNITVVGLTGGQTGTAPLYGCRAYAYFDGTGTISIKNSANVSSISDIGTGQYGVNMITALPHANFTVACMKGYSGNFHGIHFLNQTGQRTTSYFSIATWIFNSGGYEDDPCVNVCVFA